MRFFVFHAHFESAKNPIKCFLLLITEECKTKNDILQMVVAPNKHRQRHFVKITLICCIKSNHITKLSIVCLAASMTPEYILRNALGVILYIIIEGPKFFYIISSLLKYIGCSSDIGSKT